MTVAEEISAEQRLSESLEQYAGEWVAVRDHVVVAHARDLEELLEQIKEIEVDGFLQVSQDSSACFF